MPLVVAVPESADFCPATDYFELNYGTRYSRRVLCRSCAGVLGVLSAYIFCCTRLRRFICTVMLVLVHGRTIPHTCQWTTSSVILLTYRQKQFTLNDCFRSLHIPSNTRLLPAVYARQNRLPSLCPCLTPTLASAPALFPPFVAHLK